MLDKVKLNVYRALAWAGFLHPSFGIKITQERKAEILLEHKDGFGVFVETGTFEGGMIEALGDHFRKVYSIELNETLHHKNVEKLKDRNNMELLNGDSAIMIKKILEKLDEPALFWLDAHGSGSITAQNAPIIAELVAIFSHPIKRHAILIDDARHFDLATIHKIKDLAESNRNSFKVSEGLFFIQLKE